MLTMLQRRKPKKRKPSPYNVVQRTSEHKQREEKEKKLAQHKEALENLVYATVSASAMMFEQLHECLDWVDDHAPQVAENISAEVKEIDGLERLWRSKLNTVYDYLEGILGKKFKAEEIIRRIIYYEAKMFYKPELKAMRKKLFDKMKMTAVRCQYKYPYLCAMTGMIQMATDYYDARCKQEKIKLVALVRKNYPGENGESMAQEIIDSCSPLMFLMPIKKIVATFAALVGAKGEVLHSLYMLEEKSILEYTKEASKARSLMEMEEVKQICKT